MRRWFAATALALACVAPVSALPPGALSRIDVAPAATATLPLHARFRDERGVAVELGDALDARPAIVVLGYYGCSNLCSLVLHGVRQGIDDAALRPGRDIEVVVVSIAPQETPDMAAAKARDLLGTPHARGWHFLTGDEHAIDAVTAALGYRYAFDQSVGQYAHGAGITLVDAQGRIRATLPGVQYDATSLRGALSGIPPPAQAHVPWLLCFGEDPLTGRYSGVVTTAVRVGSIAVVCALAALMLVSHRRARSR